MALALELVLGPRLAPGQLSAEAAAGCRVRGVVDFLEDGASFFVAGHAGGLLRGAGAAGAGGKDGGRDEQEQHGFHFVFLCCGAI